MKPPSEGHIVIRKGLAKRDDFQFCGVSELKNCQGNCVPVDWTCCPGLNTICPRGGKCLDVRPATNFTADCDPCPNLCEGGCVDFLTDRYNCGGCGRACMGDYGGIGVCRNATCSLACLDGFSLQNGSACVSTTLRKFGQSCNIPSAPCAAPYVCANLWSSICACPTDSHSCPDGCCPGAPSSPTSNSSGSVNIRAAVAGIFATFVVLALLVLLAILIVRRRRALDRAKREAVVMEVHLPSAVPGRPDAAAYREWVERRERERDAGGAVPAPAAAPGAAVGQSHGGEGVGRVSTSVDAPPRYEELFPGRGSGQ